MSLNRYAKRRDANEPAIVDALEKAGCDVVKVDSVDLIVGRAGQNYLLEVKMPDGRIEASQKLFLESWRGQYAIVRTVDEALRAVGLQGFGPR